LTKKAAVAALVVSLAALVISIASPVLSERTAAPRPLSLVARASEPSPGPGSASRSQGIPGSVLPAEVRARRAVQTVLESGVVEVGREDEDGAAFEVELARGTTTIEVFLDRGLSVVAQERDDDDALEPSPSPLEVARARSAIRALLRLQGVLEVERKDADGYEVEWRGRTGRVLEAKLDPALTLLRTESD
jgi:hypothetical protein